MGVDEFDPGEIKKKCRDPDLEEIIGRTGVDWLFAVTSAMNGGNNLYISYIHEGSAIGDAFKVLSVLSFSASAIEILRGILSKAIPERAYDFLNKTSSVVGLLSAAGSSLSQFVVPMKPFFRVFTPLTAAYYGWKTYKLFKEY